MTFEKYLMSVWQKEVTGTEEDVLDDEMEDLFDDWLSIMHHDDMLKHAEDFGFEMFLSGMDRAKDIIGGYLKKPAIIESIKTGEPK